MFLVFLRVQETNPRDRIRSFNTETGGARRATEYGHNIKGVVAESISRHDPLKLLLLLYSVALCEPPVSVFHDSISEYRY